MPSTLSEPPAAGLAPVVVLDDYRLRTGCPVPEAATAPGAGERVPPPLVTVAVTVARAVGGTVAAQALLGAAAVPGAIAGTLRALRP